MMPAGSSRALLPLTLAAACVALPGPASAQAWLPANGEGTLYFSYLNLDIDDHLFSDEGGNTIEALDLGDIRSQSTSIGMDYGLTERLALSGAIAYVAAKYVGEFSENPEVDDGQYHGELQDVSLALRYHLVRRGSFAVTPFAGIVLPTHNYETFGHSVVGANRNELQLGVNVGSTFRPALPDLYVHGRYAYALQEDSAAHGSNRSNLDLEFGYFFTPRFLFRVFGSFLTTHGGIDWNTDIIDEESLEDHDRFAAAEALRAGGGVLFTVSRSFDLFAVFQATIDGENTHSGDTYVFGMIWTLGNGGYGIPQRPTPQPETEAPVAGVPFSPPVAALASMQSTPAGR